MTHCDQPSNQPVNHEHLPAQLTLRDALQVTIVSYIGILWTFAPHLISVSAPPCKTENKKIASYHYNSNLQGISGRITLGRCSWLIGWLVGWSAEGCTVDWLDVRTVHGLARLISPTNYTWRNFSLLITSTMFSFLRLSTTGLPHIFD